MTSPTNAEVRLLSLSQVLERLPVSRSTLYKVMRSGKLPTVRVEGRRFVTEAALAEYVRAQAS